MRFYRRCSALSKKTLAIIKKTGNEAVFQVKSNQGKLLKDCKKISINRKKDAQYISKNKGRNRIENRCVSVYHQPDFTDQNWNKNLKAVIKVKRSFEKFNPQTKKFVANGETAYYVSTEVFSARIFSRIIRGHWGIENENHYVKDVSMGEDKSRIKKNPQNMARLRSFSLNVMRVNKSKNISRDLYKNAMNIEKVLKYRYLK